MIPTTRKKEKMKIAQFIKLIGNGYREYNSYRLYKFDIWARLFGASSMPARF